MKVYLQKSIGPTGHVFPKLQPKQWHWRTFQSQVQLLNSSVKTPITTRMTAKNNTAVTSSNQSSNRLVSDTSTKEKSPSLNSSMSQSPNMTVTGKIILTMELTACIIDQCEGRWKTLMTRLKKAKTSNNLKKRPHEAQLDFIIERSNIKPTWIQGVPPITAWTMKTIKT